ncbi:MAG: FtsW/RodA/SpoVE family cell cycle protein [Eubacterium sp.]|nr:FtsW/RodA/SpoVE family cell cycle protein [Eubacterium sp.]
MELIVAEISRYIIVIFFAFYTYFSYRVFTKKTEEGKNSLWKGQRTLTVLITLLCGFILLLEKKDIKYLVLLVLELAFYFFFVKIYQVFYKGLSKLVLNNMMICMMVGFIMMGRLDYDYAIRQLLMASIAMAVCLLVPLFIERIQIWEKLGWYYAMAGLAFLALVFVIGVEKYGAKNWIAFGGFAIQPSEFVKIIYVFFIASLLAKFRDFRHVVLITILAAAHVIILVVEKDLGAALIYFVTYLAMLYTATMQVGYLLAGLAGGTGAALVAYKLFSHVRTRVIAWQDPWSHINNEGYQITRSLFAIGTGGLFGMGLGQGLPESVPVVESDFIFSAIAEEMGVIFAICLILVYISCYIMFVNIAMKMNKLFYKLTAFGLSVVFIFQTFMCIGGACKFIPSTGVTLPLISYGGSSIITTILIFSIIQGMYVLNGREEVAEHGEKNE